MMVFEIKIEKLFGKYQGCIQYGGRDETFPKCKLGQHA